MRILVVNYEYPPVGGGGGRVASHLADEMARRGHQVRVETSRVGGLPKKSVSVEGVEVWRHFSFRKKPDMCRVSEMAGYVAANILPVWKAVRSWRPDVMHVHFAVPTGAVAWPVHKLTGVPYVLTAHLGDVPGGALEQTDRLFKMVKPFTIPIWRDAAVVTAVSSHVAELAMRAYGVEPRIILNGTSVKEERPPQASKDGVLRILFTGRMSVQKNPLFLAKVLEKVKGQPWKAVFLGDGPLRGELEQDLKRAGVIDQCELRGWVDEAGVREAMRKSDLLMMPSLSEGLPMAAIEAAANGLAICGSEIPGLADVLEDGVNGWSLLLNQTEEWASVLRGMIGNIADLRRRQFESLKIAKRFDIAEVVSLYEDALSQASESRRLTSKG